MIIIITERFILRTNAMSQSNFSVMVKGHTKRGRRMGKRTDPGSEKHITFTDFTGTNEVAQK